MELVGLCARTRGPNLASVALPGVVWRRFRNVTFSALRRLPGAPMMPTMKDTTPKKPAKRALAALDQTEPAVDTHIPPAADIEARQRRDRPFGDRRGQDH